MPRMLPSRRVAQEHSWETTAAQLKQNDIDTANARFAAALSPHWDRDACARRYGEEIATYLNACRDAAASNQIKALVKLANKLSVAMERRGLSG